MLTRYIIFASVSLLAACGGGAPIDPPPDAGSGGKGGEPSTSSTTASSGGSGGASASSSTASSSGMSGVCPMVEYDAGAGGGLAGLVDECAAKQGVDMSASADCKADTDCARDEWCMCSCSVFHVAFPVMKCAPKKDVGAWCSPVDGDRECLSGKCDPGPDHFECL